MIRFLKYFQSSVYTRISIVLLPIFLATGGFAQTVIGLGKTSSGAALTNFTLYAGGTATIYTQYEDVVEGSAFFNNTFSIGKVILNDGQIFDSLSLRLDLLDNTVHYINSEEQEIIAYNPIKTVILYDSVSQKENRFDYAAIIAQAAPPGWYQLLDTGKVQLYKQYYKTMRVDRAYNSARHEKFITTTFRYYILVNTVFTQVKNIKSIPDMLQNKKKELIDYIDSNSLTGKTDADYIQLIKYYNGLLNIK